MTESPQNDAVVEPKSQPEKPVEVLLRLASAARIRRSSDGRLHARVPVADRHETFGLRSAGLRSWLTDAYFTECGKPPSLWAIQRVIAVLEARAWFDGGTPSISIRVASDPGADGSACYLDLGDPTGRAVRISSEGWVVVDKPEVHFRRPDGLLPLPEPCPDGSIDLLRQFVNLNDADFQLFIAWSTAAMRPVGPCPILALHGEQGSGKSTLSRMLHLLIDPQACPLLAEPKTVRDLMATGLSGWLLAFDNVTRINSDLSDAYCRMVTGGGTSLRKLRTDDERNIIYLQRPLILNGIEEFVIRADLVDRCIFLYLRAILSGSRRAEEAFWREFRALYPRILGGLLTAVAGGLRELPGVSLPDLPRMADFARWGEAVGRGLGWQPGAFLANYGANRLHATEPVLANSFLATVLKRLGARLQSEDWQRRTLTDLYRKLTPNAEYLHAKEFRSPENEAELRQQKAAFAARWPKDAGMLSKELRRIAPQLRLHGLNIDFERDRDGRRVVFKHVQPSGEHRAAEVRRLSRFDEPWENTGSRDRKHVIP
jgi:hypothetical protein